MKIGNLNLDNRVFLSPMAGVTDLPFRLICKNKIVECCIQKWLMQKLYVMMIKILRKC